MKYYKLKTVAFYIFVATVISFDLKGSENENEGICSYCNCCKEEKEEDKKEVGEKTEEENKEEKKEIAFKDYYTQNDEALYEVESNQNFLKYISLYEYLNLLDIFTIENSTIKTELPNKLIFSSKDEFFQKDMNIKEFQSFIENKIFNLKDIKDLIGNNETTASIFKQICIEIYQALELKLSQHYDSNDDVVIKKKNLIPLGLLFCNCNNIEKIKLFFDLFKNENEEFCKSYELDIFMLTDFLTGSYCLIDARNKIGKNFYTISELKRDELIRLVNCAELKDNQNLLKVFNETFFDKEKFTWVEFKQKFEDKENGFGWIFSSQGIRRKLEEHNV